MSTDYDDDDSYGLSEVCLECPTCGHSKAFAQPLPPRRFGHFEEQQYQCANPDCEMLFTSDSADFDWKIAQEIRHGIR